MTGKPSAAVALILLASLLSGCLLPGLPVAAPGTLTPTPTVQAASSPVPTMVGASTPPADSLPSPTANDPGAPSPTPLPAIQGLPLPGYTITATLSFSQHRLEAEQAIVYYNHSSDTLDEIVMAVPPAEFSGVFSLQRLGTAEAPLEYVWDKTWLRVRMAQPLAPGGRLDLNLAYTLDLPSPIPSSEIRPIPFGYTAEQTNLVDWYPFIAPYTPGKGWLVHSPGYFGEHLVYEQSDFAVALRITDELPGMEVAASAPAQVEGGWRRYRHAAARSFAFSILPNYKVSSQQVGDVTVLSYYAPFDQAAGELALQTTAQALELFSSLFGAYQRPTLSVVEASFLDGMEYDGIYFLSKGFYNLFQPNTPGQYLVAIAAHETAHQWWYGQIGNDQALEPWLDEALCTYSEHIFYERVAPEGLDWWWQVRVKYYEPRGPVNGSIYSYSGNPSPYRSYRDAVYLNGAIYLDALRARMGDGPFFDFLKSYASQYAGQISTSQDFMDMLAKYTQADLSDLRSQYFLP